MMFSMPRARALVASGALAGAGPLLACGLLTGCGQPGPGAAQQAQAAPAARAGHAAGRFSAPLTVSNQMFPLVAGAQFVYQGKIVEDGESKPHSVVFTVTDLSKVVDHVRTVVAWDRDFLEGRLQEQELAFFAQDDRGNVWNFGEYPEEYEHGRFTGAPSTWIREAAGAYGGIHMLARPRVGARYREGLVPAIEFDDVSRVARAGQVTCVQARCYRQVLVVDETSPNDPTSGHQIKYYSPHAGLVRVAASGGDSQEFLTLAAVRHLDGHAMAKIRAAVLAMDRRAYRVSEVYRVTKPAERRRG
jgi:hypothetical protein